MSPFKSELSRRIRQLTGTDCEVESNYPFSQAGGNEHLIQFFYKYIPWELLELDRHSQHRFFLMDLAEKTGIDYNLDDDGLFAVLVEKNKKKVKTVQAVMDLRDEDIALVYYLGNPKNCQQINQALCRWSNVCYFSSPILLEIAKNLASVNWIQYGFEQASSVFQNPLIMKGEFKGAKAIDICRKFTANYKNWFNVESVAGCHIDGARGMMVFNADGTIQIDACRLSGLLEVANQIYTLLKEKHEYMVSRYLTAEGRGLSGNFTAIGHGPLEIDLPIAIENIESFIKCFINGQKPLRFIGISERISPKLWQLKSTDTTTGNQIEFELSNYKIRIKIKQKHSLFLVDRIEQFLRKHICAHLVSLAF